MKKFVVVVILLILAGFLIRALIPSGNHASGNNTTAYKPGPNDVEVVFTYGSEKEEWIKAATDEFNSGNHKTSDGKNIHVSAYPMGSGDCIDELLAGTRQADITSPASAAFITLGNAQSKTKTGKDLIGPTQNLVLSPVVIAMWKPMAQAIGWGKKPIGWADILSLARNRQGWSSYGHPEWGSFKFGHTHPEFSNSGLISIMAEVYAARKVKSGLTLADVDDPKTSTFVSDIEKSVVHYGSSTGFFGKKMFDNGPQYLSAAVLYESMVSAANNDPSKLPLPVVAIYPKEGTFWSDHPIGIVQREWVTDEHKDAAKQYIAFLLSHDQQEKAMTLGFRPADVSISLASPIDVAHGVDPKEPKTTLQLPSAQVINEILKTWHRQKKHSNAVLVLDCSGSMQNENKLVEAKAGAEGLLSMLGAEDCISVLPFSDNMNWIVQNARIGKDKKMISDHIEGLFPEGGTRLYDSIQEAFRFLQNKPNPGRISAIIVLTDGDDTASRMTYKDLIAEVKSDNERKNVRIFTIGYGSEANKDVLKGIADATQAKYYDGTPENIREVFKDISTFF